jgi:hypothetical protein
VVVVWCGTEEGRALREEGKTQGRKEKKREEGHKGRREGRKDVKGKRKVGNEENKGRKERQRVWRLDSDIGGYADDKTTPHTITTGH